MSQGQGAPQATGGNAGGMALPGASGNIFSMGSDAMKLAYGTTAATVNPLGIRQSMNTFASPYRAKVIDDAVGRLRDRKALDLNEIKANAAQSGAFGGSRHGLVESTTIDNYGREEDEMVSRLLQEGFDTSSNLAIQQLGLMQSGAGQLGQLGGQFVQTGNTMLDRQNQAGTQQQQLLQAILSGAAGQFDEYTKAPINALGSMLGAVSSSPLANNMTKTESYKPGMFDYLSMGAGVYGAGK